MEFDPNRETNVNELLKELMASRPTVIGIEGGPCGGKTTLIRRLTEEASLAGRQLVLLPEAATQHIAKLQENGIDPAELAGNDREGWLAFEADVMRTIHDQIVEAQETYAGTDAIIVADRCDIGAYITETEHAEVLEQLGYEQPPMTGLVDQIYFLPSVARESAEKYERLRGTNDARYENAEAAVRSCDANLRSVAAHPELHIAWGGEFNAKIDRLVSQILQADTEGEVKFGVDPERANRTLQAAVDRGDALNAFKILQSYHEHNGQEFRLREMEGRDGITHYYFTVKTGEGTFRQELQRKITFDQFYQLARAEQLGNTLMKMRYSYLDYDLAPGRRLWHADAYVRPPLDEWHLETDVHDQAEHDNLVLFYEGTHRRVTESAKALIFKEG